MAEVKWIKITTDIFDDEKILLIESLPDSYAIITVWFKLLCLAGKQNNSGVFLMGRIPYTDKMLATIFRMKETSVTLALKTFEEFGMIEIVDGVITIPNWGKHQNLDQLESKKQYMRNYMAEYREKQKALTSGKSNCKTNGKANVSQAEEDIDKEIDKDKEDIYPFDEFWSAYPKKKAKEAAKKAWVKLKPDETLGKTIIAAVLGSANTTDWKKENGKYIPYPATYLNGKRWEDERNDDNGQDTRNTRKVQYGTVI
jgi:predicted phage replisome organizer